MSSLSDEVERLLRERIESFEQLEVLLLLRREGDQSWTAEAIGERLNLSPAAVVEALEHLCRVSLASKQHGNSAPMFRYGGGALGLDSSVDRLATLHADERLLIMGTLNSNAIERVRNLAVRRFADAFVIKRGKKDG